MNKTNPRILIAGATGYLGSHIVNVLLKQKVDFKVLVRSKNKLLEMGLLDKQIEIAHVTDASTLHGCCEGIDVVISSVGITRQKDGLSFMDVDFQANLNLLEEAERAGVKKFIYISAFNAPKYQGVRLLRAKERFAKRLLASKVLEPCIVRPNGFFSDIEEFYSMAKSGRVYVFGKGNVQLNPIHGEDLARFCLEVINKEGNEFDIGGAEVFSVYDVAELAFHAQDKTPRITCLPDWVRKISLFIAAKLPEKFGGPAEFFLTVMAQNMVAPTYGKRKLGDHFRNIFQEENK
ncbi:SDR family oxidoreductase [Psychromonas hadalis]|uniref:SDR family oxidoreductase n=1 Tax=Psychromonas hadalis TaxID=211669 RepID=UPI0003B4C5D3|nr:SDR family oxidoreductase [Psychromonas hadalis]